MPRLFGYSLSNTYHPVFDLRWLPVHLGLVDCAYIRNDIDGYPWRVLLFETRIKWYTIIGAMMKTTNSLTAILIRMITFITIQQLSNFDRGMPGIRIMIRFLMWWCSFEAASVGRRHDLGRGKGGRRWFYGSNSKTIHRLFILDCSRQTPLIDVSRHFILRIK